MERRDAVDGASTAAREGACAPPFQRAVRYFPNPTTRLHFDAATLKCWNFHLSSARRLPVSSASYVRDCHSIGGNGGAETHAPAEVSLTCRAHRNAWASWKPR